MATTDRVQRLREAIVAALDTREGIQDLTRQEAANVIPWKDAIIDVFADETREGVIAYAVITATRGGLGLGDPRRCRVSFTAFARSEAVANALAEQVELGLTCVTLGALSPPLDARVEDIVRQDSPPDAEDGVYSAIVDLTLVVTS